MKGTKKFAATLLASLMIVISLFGFAGCELFQEKTKVFFRYKLSEDGEYYIVKGLDYSKNKNPVKEICIPSTYEGKPVKEIADSAFSDRVSLTSVEIPDSITKIGALAFNECSGIMNFELPDSVTDVSCNSFLNSGYYNDKNNWTDDGVLYIGKHLIAAREKIVGDIIIKDGTICIADQAFRKCQLFTTITIPDSIKHIGANAFDSCDALNEVNYKGTAEDWTAISFENYDSNPYFGYADNLYIKGELATEITEVTIPENVTEISGYAFYKWGGLTKVNMHDNITSIGHSAFSGCEALTEIALPESLVSIGTFAFHTCINLSEIVIPDGVTSISQGLFNSCQKLSSVTLGENVTIIEDSAFGGCERLQQINIPEGVISIGVLAFNCCCDLTNIDIPASVTYIGKKAFKDSGLTKAFFGNKTGWIAGEEKLAEVGTTLADASMAAKYLVTTYMDYAWMRVEEDEN